MALPTVHAALSEFDPWGYAMTGSSHLLLGIAPSAFHGKGIFGTYADALLPETHCVEGGQTSTGSIVNWYEPCLICYGLLVGYLI